MTSGFSNSRLKAVLVLIVAILFATSPFLSGAFGGFDPNRFPIPQIDPPVVPAVYAFAIWGPIYVYLLVSAAYGLWKRVDNPDWDPVRWPLIASLAAGAAWIPIAKASPLWATIVIWLMLLTALAAVFRSSETTDRWLLRVPLAVYSGWLTAASFVSVGLVGAGYGIGTGQVGWAWIAMILAVAVAGFVQTRLARAPEYGLTLVWALVAIAVRNFESNVGIALFALAGAVVMGGLTWRSATRS